MSPWYGASCGGYSFVVVVVGSTAGSQRSGTRNTSGTAESATSITTTTELVAEAAKNTWGSFCKKQQRTAGQTQQRQKARER